jgi:hypothetical protein
MSASNTSTRPDSVFKRIFSSFELLACAAAAYHRCDNASCSRITGRCCRLIPFKCCVSACYGCNTITGVTCFCGGQQCPCLRQNVKFGMYSSCTALVHARKPYATEEKTF